MWLLKKKPSNKWSAWLFEAFIFSIPFKTALFVYAGEWGRGFTNPYLSFSFSLPELFLGLSALFFYLENRKERWRKGGPFLLPVLLVLATATNSLLFSSTEDPFLKLLLLTSLLEVLLVYLMMVSKVIKVNQFFKVLSLSMSFQAMLGIFQTIMGHGLGLGFLGEPSLSSETAHIAKLSFGNVELIRAYGTFSHPNILGGFLAVSILGTLLYPPKSNKERNTHLSLQFVGLLFSFSRSALLGLIAGVLLLSIRSIKEIRTNKNRWITRTIFLAVVLEAIFLIASRPFPLSEDPAIQSRMEGYKNGIELMIQNPLGLGFGMETLFLDEVSQESLKPWEYQPVHNIFLLFGAETGWVGLITLLGLMGFTTYKLTQHHKILGRSHEHIKRNFFLAIGTVMVSIGCFDHYWLSLEEGRFLAILIIASIARFLSDPLPVFPIKKGASLLKSPVGLLKKHSH